MKPFSLCLLLLFNLTSTTPTFSQTINKNNQVYLVFFYVKPLNALHHDYINYERKIQAPIQQQVVNAGNMISWSIYWVETSSDYTRDYDFVAVKAFKSLKDMDIETPNAFEKAHPGKNRDSLLFPVFRTRESPRREIWVVDEETANEFTGNHKSPRMLLNFSNIPMNDNPTFQKLKADSVIKNWESYSILLPQGEYPYRHLSLCTFEKYEALPNILKASSSSKKMAVEKNNSTQRTKQEMWWKWAGTN
jgi:hypothetical protein